MSYFAPNLPQGKHCFFGAKNGVSEGLYASLNVNTKSNDNQDNIAKNLDIIAKYYNLPRQNLMLLNQGITGNVCYSDEISQNKITADGIVTKNQEAILCIGTADCAPVLFYDEKNKIIGAAHAGWRGALRGVVENTLHTMLEYGAEKNTIAIAVGPCLQQPSFEASTDMLQEFTTIDSNFSRFFAPGRDDEHFQFDMEGFIRTKLELLNCPNTSFSDIDTYKKTGDYFSFRRNTHLGLVKTPKDFPSHISTIKL